METERTAGNPPPLGQALSSTRGATGTPSLTSSRFHGDGVRYKAKLIGVDQVPEAQGDKMCWDSMMKLKGCEAALRKQGKHKQRVWLKVWRSGLKVVDERSGSVLHDHNRTRISSVTKDQSDPRALAYIYHQEEADYRLFYIKTANLADPVLADIREICQSEDAPEEPEEPEEPQTSSLVLLSESSAPPEEPDLKPEMSPRPGGSSGPPDQVSSCEELMEVFSVQLKEPLSPSLSFSPSVSEPPHPPQPLLSTSQILSMFPRQPLGPPPYASPPYSPSAIPRDQGGLLGNQWAGPAVVPWPTVPSSVAAWTPGGVTAPTAGAVSSQSGVTWGGGTPSSPTTINSPPTLTGAAVAPSPDSDLLL